MQPNSVLIPIKRWKTDRVCRLFILFVMFLVCAQSVQAEVVYSKSRRFRIPFQFDSVELKRLGTKEIQLYVSQDGGDHWRLADSVSPDVGKFTYEAPEDGAYWFSVKSVAGSGLIYPAGPHQAGLNVLVDSTPPELMLRLDEVEAGRVRLAWSVHDANLDLTSLKLEFRDSSSSVWSVVAVRTQSQGQTSWTISNSGPIEVRGEVADLSGNVTESTTVCNVEEPPVQNDKPDFTMPFADKELPEQQEKPAQAVKNSRNDAQLTASPGKPSIKDAAMSSNAGSSPEPLAITDPAPQLQAVHHKINSSSFRVAYSLNNVGPSGVKQVDVFISEDDGQKWFHYGQDPDRVSPIEITVPRDGEYGLAFRVMNGLGRVDIPPQPGDRPEVRITVDRTPPVVELMPLEHGRDLESNKVLISWSAHDQDLAERPVALFYSVAATGPWEAIDSWQANSGQIHWPVPTTLNQPFYVRLDVKDNAGNVTRVYSEKPFVVDRTIPRARVTEIEPVINSSR